MIKKLFILSVLFLLTTIPGCKKSSPTDELSQSTEPLIGDQSNTNSQKTDQLNDAQNQNDNAPDLDTDKQNTNEKPDQLYANLPDQAFPVPSIDGKPAPYNSVDTNDAHTGTFYIYSDHTLKDIYDTQLKNAGFTLSNGGNYIKIVNDKTLIVKFAGDEGEFRINMFTSTDPANLYAKMPDPRIPYPIELDFAAGYDHIELPNEASNETVFEYLSKSKQFISDYEKQLKDAGFTNTRIPESPLYVKSVDEKTEFSVAIDTFDNYSKIRIKIMVNIFD